MNKSGPNGLVAVAVTALVLAAVAVALLGAGVPLTCDPPRHDIVVSTADGFGRHECVSATAPPTAANQRRP